MFTINIRFFILNTATRKARGSAAKQVNPIVSEFQQCCKVVGFQDEETVTELSTLFAQSESQIKIMHKNIGPQLGKALLRLFQKYQKLLVLSFYACPILDFSFYRQLSVDLLKNSVQFLSFDYAPIQRESITPFLAIPSIESLSLEGNQCLTSYDFVTHEHHPFPQSLNMFFNALATSQVKILNLFGCHIGDDGTVALASSLYFNTSLRCICLTKNRIGNKGASALASALSRYVLNENEAAIIEKLVNDESKQRISDEGGGLLKRKKGQKGPAKKPPPKITKKGMAASRILTERAHNFDPEAPVMPQILAKWSACVAGPNNTKYLPGNATLTSLLLSDNRIGHAGFEALKEMLAVNSNISVFRIDHNPEIDECDAQTLAKTPAKPQPEPPAAA